MSIETFNELRDRALMHDTDALCQLMQLAVSRSFLTHRAQEALSTIGVAVAEAA